MKTRMQFVEKWANFVKENPDSEWSRLQKELIDSQLTNSIKLTKEQVDKIKNRKSSGKSVNFTKPEKA
mgnify:CR=1 FL=1